MCQSFLKNGYGKIPLILSYIPLILIKIQILRDLKILSFFLVPLFILNKTDKKILFHDYDQLYKASYNNMSGMIDLTMV